MSIMNVLAINAALKNDVLIDLTKAFSPCRFYQTSSLYRSDEKVQWPCCAVRREFAQEETPL